MNITPDETPANTTPTEPSMKDKLEQKRSNVRRWVTYIATWFVFFGGAAMIGTLFFYGDKHGVQSAKDLFLAILPVGTGIITYWFAGRSAEKKGGQN